MSGAAGDGTRADWSQLLLVGIAILVLLVGAGMAAGVDAPDHTAALESMLTGENGQPDIEFPGENGDGDEPPPESDPNGADRPPDEEPNGEEETPPVTSDDRTDVAGAEYSDPSEEVVFQVEAEQPAYWRVTAYDQYTGNQWERSPDLEPIDPDRYTQHVEPNGQYVMPRTEMHALPAAWMPFDWDDGAADISRDSANGLALEESIDDDHHGVPLFSLQPITEPELLERTGTSYPDEIESHYTDASPELSDRVIDYTDELTADAETPYEKATIIAYYLRTNHGYSLEIPPPEGEVTDELLFEREEAYCTYFATAMTNMLRTQDVPARYVTGYGTGEYDEGDGLYTVRGANAHAWVEVYFPEVGWVPFEPTPSDDRDDTIDEDFDDTDASLADNDPTPNEDLEAELERMGHAPEELRGTDDDDEDPEPPEDYDIQIDGDVIPGETIRIGVYYQGEPVENAGLTLNDEAIGTTGPHGTLETEVPWVRELEIGVDPPADTVDAVYSGPAFMPQSVDDISRTVPTDGELNVTLLSIPVASSEGELNVTMHDRPVPDATITLDDTYLGTTDDAGELTFSYPDDPDSYTLTAERGEFESTVELDVDELTASSDAVFVPGKPVAFTVEAGETPIPGVLIQGPDGTEETNEDGQVTQTLPDSPGAETLELSYRGATASKTIDVHEPSYTIDARPMPNKSITVNATVADDPLPNATITTAADETITNESGLASLTLPDDTGDTEVTFSYASHETSTTLDLRPLELKRTDRFAVPLSSGEYTVTWDDEPVENATLAYDGGSVGETDAAGVVSARYPITDSVAVSASRSGSATETTVDGLFRNLALFGILPLALLGAVGAWKRDQVLAAAGTGQTYLAIALAIAHTIPPRIIDQVVSLARWLDSLRARGIDALHDLLPWLRTKTHALVRRLRSLLAHPRALPGILLASLRSLLESLRDDALDDSTPPTSTRSTHSVATTQPTIHDLWQRFLRTVRPPGLRTRTPGEIKRYAIDRGFPKRPVERIVDAFRAVAYDHREPSDPDIEAIEQAVDETTSEEAA